ncbi:MAG: hypothetical protein OSJ70_00910 [Bacilli bacterium]|nr:hypothetical protein [Bacilli bacterium]
MALKTKNDYCRKILEKKDILIDELVDEFGEETRTLLDQNFDKINFLFFIGIPNLRKQINQKYSKKAADTTLDFIKNFIGFQGAYINEEFYELSGYTIDGKPRNVLNNIYGENFITFDLAPNHLKNNIEGIWSFNPDIDMEKVKRYGESRGKTSIEMLTSLKCTFLRYLKKYPEDFTDEQIISDSHYQEYCEYYSNGIKKYLCDMEENQKCVSEELALLNYLMVNKSIIYLESLRSILRDYLYPYLSESDKRVVDSGADFQLEDVSLMHQIFYYNQDLEQPSKVELMSDDEINELVTSPSNNFSKDIDVRKIVKEARENANKKAIIEYNRLVVFNTNMDLAKETPNIDLSKLDGEMISIFEQEDGIEKGRYIVFDPYASPEENYDVHLRHELRHSLTTSMSINQDGIVIVKVGNNLFFYLNNQLIGSENTDFNEYFTQKKALANTKEAYKHGIYVLTPPNTQAPTPVTSGYDVYLPEFDKIYSCLSSKARQSVIEPTNEKLYSEIPPISIKDLESKISHGEILDENILKELIETKCEDIINKVHM